MATSSCIENTALLRLMHLVSPALPVGMFAYSQGLEWAIEEGGINTAERIESWLESILSRALVVTDLAVLFRLQGACEKADEAGVEGWNEWLLASRETQELLDEDRQIGNALIKLLVTLQVPGAERWLDRPVAVATAWSIAAHDAGIPPVTAALGYAWNWLENQISVAGKTLPLPQSPAQRILHRLTPAVDAAVQRAMLLPDDELGGSLPGWVFASSRHETQYSRLFRS